MNTMVATQSSPAHRQQGFSLVEGMIALTLGVVLLAGTGQIYAHVRQAYRSQLAQSRIQENARYALELISHDLRLSGYFGCNSASKALPTPIANSPLTAMAVVSGGDDNTGTFADPNPKLSASLPVTTDPPSTLILGTDAVTVQFGDSCGGKIDAAMTGLDPTGIISSRNTCGIAAGMALVIGDCAKTDIFRAITSGLNSRGTFAAGYAVGAEIMRFRSYTYFIQANASSQPSLWRFDNNTAGGTNNPVELVEGIEDMQVAYGVDSGTDGSANYYVDADAVGANWAKVVAVRVTITARSLEDNLTLAPTTVTYNGASVTDHRLRKSFTATVGLRNFLL